MSRINNTQANLVVNTVANSGTGGGTWNYINIGNIKMAWITSPNVASKTTVTGYTFVFPTGFFSAAPTTTVSAANMATFGEQYCSVGTISNTTASVNTISPNGVATTQISLMAIGV